MPGVMAVEPGVRGVEVPLRAERERADSERLVSVPVEGSKNSRLGGIYVLSAIGTQITL